MSWSSTNAFSEMVESGGEAAAADSSEDQPRTSRQRRRRSAPAVRWSREVGAGLVVAGIAVAPLAAGGVHRASSLALMAALALGFVLLAASLGLSKRSLRVGAAVALPLALLLVPIVQSIPLPLGLRAHLDPRGTELLRDVSLHSPSAWPLS